MTNDHPKNSTIRKPCIQPPSGTYSYDGILAEYWWKEGILYAILNNRKRTLELQKANFDFVREFTKNQPVCILVDATLIKVDDKESRDYTALEMPKLYKAMAVMSASPFGRFIFNVFLRLKKPSIPTRLFTSEEEARKWLERYI